MTSDDRHASPDSPYRSGAHVSLGQSRHSPLTTVTSAANDSRADLTPDEAGFTPSAQPTSPQTPYKPGMRTLQRQSSHPDTAYAANGMTNGDMPMQSFADGLPPPPPVAHTWERIDSWLEDNYEELYENLGEGCTINDVNELEHELDASLPQDVRESLMIHDGQERGGRPTGVLFSCMLLDCEEIVQEWKQWARTNDEYLRDTPSYTGPPAPIKAFAGSSNSARTASPSSSAGSNWRQDLLSRQDSQPANAVRKAYVHPAWIPLARDWGGNNICVDLAPGPTGQWGQVILMGRDYDCKYVVARSWGTFLANIADDMATSKWFIDEDTHELKLREFPRQNVEPAYIDILRWRADQKYGRRFPPRDASAGGGNKSKRPMGQQSGVPSLSINSQVNGGARAHADGSPYSSPTTGPHSDRDRGRSPTSSFAPHSRQPPAPSPLSRVTEESSTVTSDLAGAPRLQTHIESPSEGQQSPPSRVDRLISVDSPVIGASAEAVLKQLDSAKKTEGGVDTVNGDQDKTPRKAVSTGDGRDAQDNKENLAVKVDPKLAAAIAGAENELKTIEI